MVNRNESVHSASSAHSASNQSQQLNKLRRIKPHIRPGLRYIGLHSFSRKLYRDVPDEFDDLKKLFARVRNCMKALKNEEKKIKSNVIQSTTLENPTTATTSMVDTNLSEFMTQFNDSSNQNLVNASHVSQLTLNTADLNLDKPVEWFKWIPSPDQTGEAIIKVLKENQEIELKYHIANCLILKDKIFNDKLLSDFVNILSFAFQNYLEKRKINIEEFNKENSFVKIRSKHPIKFLITNLYHEYSILDVLKIYFDYLIKSVEGSNESVIRFYLF